MRITTRITWDIETGNVLNHEYFDYEGPLCLAGGGPSAAQTAASQQQLALSKQEGDIAQQRLDRENQQFSLVQPYYQSLLNNGIPYRDVALDFAGGTSARAWAPAYMAASKRFAPNGFPSGSRDAAFRSIDADRARSYDQNLQGILASDAAARASGAAGLVGQQQLSDPSQWFQNANSGNNSIMQAQSLRSTGIGGIFGSLAGSLGGSAITAFCPVEGSMVLMFDGSRKKIESLDIGCLVLSRDGDPDEVIAKPQPRFEECVRVSASNGAAGCCSVGHALMHPSGGFVRANDSQGSKVLTDSLPAMVTNVEPIGKRVVYQLRLKSTHSYCADGFWALE